MKGVVNSTFLAWRFVVFTFALVVSDSVTEALGLCQFQALIQNSTASVEGFNSSEDEMWTQWDRNLYLPGNKTQMTWEDAMLECKRHNQDAHLVYIESEDEHEFVYSLAYLYDNFFWIGLSDEDMEGSWKWNRTTTAHYIKWESGEPNGGTIENCAVMLYPSRGWLDISCSTQNYFLCERTLPTLT